MRPPFRRLSADFLEAEKGRDLHASIPEILRRARERGILKPHERVSRSTLYRTAKRLRLSLARRKCAKDRDSRRFAYPHRMEEDRQPKRVVRLADG